jgi:hypothetical protein
VRRSFPEILQAVEAIVLASVPIVSPLQDILGCLGRQLREVLTREKGELPRVRQLQLESLVANLHDPR